MSDLQHLTTTELADAVGVSPRTVRRHCAAGIIPGAAKVGRDWTIPLAVAEVYARTYVPYQGLRKAPAGASTHPAGAPVDIRESTGNERVSE